MERHAITLAHGATTEARAWPSADKRAAVVVFLPAMGTRASYYDTFGQALSDAGFHAVIGDFRNHGAGSVRPSRAIDFGYRELIREDCAELIAFARQRFPGSPVLAGGHSLGGHVTALYATLAPPGELAGLFSVAAGTVHFRAYEGRRALSVLVLTQLTDVMSRVLGIFPGHRIGFAGLEPKTQMLDWARAARTGRFMPSGDAHDYERALRDVRLPLLVLSIEDDDYAPASAARGLYGKLTGAAPTFETLALAAFGRKRVGHFSWAKTPLPVVERIRAWWSAR
jgi:predicted alpha/beta hydrolase